ncbi:MAG: hypothetical protein ACLRHN_07580 [Ruminococcus sp.]|uniref:hypothetical protein n=1 Tax=Ruminococcus sp. TaxID=41978 RepID=UPI0039A14492
MTTQEMNTNITNTNEPAEKKTNKKKIIGIVAVATVTVAAVIIAMLTACGNKQPTATADEVIGISVQSVPHRGAYNLQLDDTQHPAVQILFS